MKKILPFAIVLLSIFCFINSQEKKKNTTYDIPIYPNDLISVTTKRGEISVLIKKISDNHKAIPAITITPSARNVFIPAVEAQRTTLGKLFKRLHLFKDNVTKKQLIVNIQKFSIEISAVDLPGEALEKVIDQSKYKIISYRIVLLRDKISLKTTIPLILKTYNKQWDQEAVLRYNEKDDYVYIFGLPDDVKILTKTFDELNKIELKKKDADIQVKAIIEKILNTLFLEKVDNKILYYKKYIVGYAKEISELEKKVKADDAAGAKKIKNEIKEFNKLIKENEKLINNLTIMKNLIQKKLKK